MAKILIGLFLILGVIGYRIHHRHHLVADAAEDNQPTQERNLAMSEMKSNPSRLISNRGQGAINNLSGRSPASIPIIDLNNCGTDQACLKRSKHHTMVKAALGGDAVGVGAMDLLGVKSCAKVAACASNPKMFFAMALSRLDPTTMAVERLNLQHYLMDSTADKADKNALLSNLLQDPRFAQVTPTSQQTGDRAFTASQDAMYLMATQLQLIKTGASVDTVIQASLAAITNTQDQFAKSVMTAALLKRYPDQKDTILASIGVK